MRKIASVSLAASLLIATPIAARAVTPTKPDIRLAAGAGLTAPVEFLVSFDAARTSSAAVSRAILSAGGKVHPYSQFPVVGGQGSAAAVAAAAAVNGVRVIEPNASIKFLDVAPLHALGVDTVSASSPQGLGVNGSGVTVGVIDSGADGTHPDLASRLKRNVKVAVTWITCDGDPTAETCLDGQDRQPDVIDMQGQNADTTSGHGSHVAGIIAGTGAASAGLYTGAAPGAQIDSVGVGDGANILWSLDGFEYLLAHATEDKLIAISNSWGSSRAAATSDSAAATNAVATAVTAALSRNISVVFAAGNDGVDTAGTTDYCDATHQFSNINPYALIPGVIGAASSSRDGLAASSFSSCGKGTTDRSQDPTVTAPGGNIMSVRGGPATYVDPTLTTAGQSYTEASGTSMATPHISGSIALIQSARLASGRSLLSPAAVKSLLVSTATPIAGVAPRKQGAGLVDDLAAVAQARNLAAPARLAGVCPVVKDLAGDATQALVNTPTPSVPSLDVTTAGLSSVGGSLTATIHLTGLDLNEVGGGDGQYYDFNFSTGGKNYFLSADHRHVAASRNPPSAGVETYTYAIGRYDTVRAGLATGVGTFDPSSATVTITVPLSATAKYDFTGATLDSITVVSRRELNTAIPNADSAYSTQGYVVGTTC